MLLGSLPLPKSTRCSAPAAAAAALQLTLVHPRLRAGCFGAVVVNKTTKEIVGEGYNHVIGNNDPTWHGEMAAIRAAGARLGRPHLTGCVLYTSAEPCPMCFTASLWARLDKVYYAATYGDVKQYGNFDDADFLAELCKPPAERSLCCTQIMQAEAVEVWKKFAAMPDKCHY